ncbi:ABC transporter ATP-binding protein [Cereibacter sphaeroides]|uniref:ABC transporter ATP-binding protein n=1 Tax=Cereibacter sphaeroides TaxID=1063 RepID=UPI003FCC5A7C
MTLLAISDITKSFAGHKALDHVTLDIRQGEFISLLGPSGCGKTTLLRTVAGFMTADKGRILIDGEDVSRLPPERRPLNTVFQNYALFPHMTVLENVAYGPRRAGLSRAEADRRAEEALEMVGLAAMSRRNPAAMSGGQQQRVALARAIVNRPKLLLLDEPLSALDLQLRKRMQIELKQLQVQLGITFIFVTHDQDEAMAMSDRIAVMSAGRLEQCDAPEAIYRRPRTRFVAEFIGEANFLPLDGTGPEGVLRPEDLRVLPEGEALPPGWRGLPARVTGVTYVGGTSNIYLADGPRELLARSYGLPPAGISAGRTVQAGFDPANLHPLGA